MTQENLIQIPNECTTACQKCADACLNEENVKMLARCINLDLDCAAITAVTADLAARNSKILNQQLDVCMEICKRCAEECEMHASNMQMEHCNDCGEACRRGEEACQTYA